MDHKNLLLILQKNQNIIQEFIYFRLLIIISFYFIHKILNILKVFHYVH